MPDIRNEIIDNLQIRGSVSGGNLGSLARAVRVAMTAATAVTGIRVADSDNIEPGTSNFTFSWKGQIADTAINNYLFIKYQTSNVRWRFVLGASKLLSFIYTTGGVDVISAVSTASAIVENNQENVYTISVTRETATTAGSVIFFVNGVPLGAPVAIAAAATADINNTAALFLGATLDATGRVACNFGEAFIFNRALSAAEVLSLYNNGPALADLGASQTNAVTNPDAEGGVTTGWAANTIGGTITANAVTPISGTYDFLVTSAAANYGVRTTVFSMVTGVRYRLQFKYRAAAGSWFVRVNNGNAYNNTAGYGPIGLTEDGTVQTFSVEFTASGGGADLHFYDSSAGSTTLYLDDVSFVRIGITGWWDARDAQSDTGQILDSSGNKNHAMLPASGATVLPKPLADRSVRGTRTFTASATGQHVCGVDQAVIPTDGVWQGTAIIKSDTIVTVNLGDGVDADRYAALAVLAVGYNVITFLTRLHDGTNRKLVVTPSASTTCVLQITALYDIVE